MTLRLSRILFHLPISRAARSRGRISNLLGAKFFIHCFRFLLSKELQNGINFCSLIKARKSFLVGQCVFFVIRPFIDPSTKEAPAILCSLRVDKRRAVTGFSLLPSCFSINKHDGCFKYFIDRWIALPSDFLWSWSLLAGSKLKSFYAV